MISIKDMSTPVDESTAISFKKRSEFYLTSAGVLGGMNETNWSINNSNRSNCHFDIVNFAKL